MTRHGLLGLVAIAAVAGCSGGTEPIKYGPIDSRITQGEKQTYVAGGQTPSPVIDLVFRNPLTGSVIPQPSRLERLLLPKLAYALQTVGVNVKVQPNSVVCVGEEQSVLVPAVRCVNSDAEGNTRFDFLATTKAGTHQALIRATYGLETTIPDTVEIVVAPAAADPFFRSGSLPLQCSPAVLPVDAVRDRYLNAVPFRIVSDGRLTVGGTTAGTVDARTVTFTAAQADPVNQSNYYELALLGSTDELVGSLQYRIGTGTGSCSDGTTAHRIDWRTKGKDALGW